MHSFNKSLKFWAFHIKMSDLFTSGFLKSRITVKRRHSFLSGRKSICGTTAGPSRSWRRTNRNPSPSNRARNWPRSSKLLNTSNAQLWHRYGVEITNFNLSFRARNSNFSSGLSIFDQNLAFLDSLPPGTVIYLVGTWLIDPKWNLWYLDRKFEFQIRSLHFGSQK